MGVCGCGKTSVGQALANRLGWQFFDADDFHPPANVAKMATGVALTDEDREPWLDRLATEMRVVYLKGDANTIEPRLALRSGHYMSPSLLASQFAALEEPEQAMVIDIRQTTEAQAAQIAAALQSTV